MSEVKVQSIKVLGGFYRKSPNESLEYAKAVHAGIFADPIDYPTPPVDEPTYKANIDDLSAKITAALDGGQKAIAARNHQVTVVNKMTAELGHYVESACGNNMPTFLKSGFQPKSTTKVIKPPVSQWIRAVAPGRISGQLYLLLMAVVAAAAYEIRYAVTVNGTPGPWQTQLVTKTRPATTLSGLTPGALYTIQVRSFNDATGFTDWSDPVTRIVT